LILNKKKSFVPYLKFDCDKLQLKDTHKYFTQVQVSMYVLKCQICHFVVFSSKQTVVIEIPRADSFLAEYIPKLEVFYFNYFLPALVK